MPIHIFLAETTCVSPLLVCTVASLLLQILVPLAEPLEEEPVDVHAVVTVTVPVLVAPTTPLDEEEDVSAPPAGVDSVKIDSEVPVGVKRG
jgi:hypothetical protein